MSLVAGLLRPALGCIAFYFFYLLDPTWNWRWSIPPDIGFQKWIFASTCIGFLLFAASTYRTPLRVWWALLSITCFGLMCLISTTFSRYPDSGFAYISLLWRILAISIITVFSISTTKDIRLFAWSCVIAQGYNALQINLEYLTFGYCKYAYLADWGHKGLDNNGYCLLTVPVFAIAIAIGFSSKNWTERTPAFFFAALQVHQVMLMESRGGMLGLVLTSLLAVFFMPKSTTNISMVVCGLIVGSFLAGPPVIKEFISSFESSENRDSSAESRFHLWYAGSRIIVENPLVGVGPNASRFYVPEHYSMTLDSDRKALHNIFFEVGAETGVLGLLFFLTFFIIPFWDTYRSRNIPGKGNCDGVVSLSVLAGMPGYFLSSMFSSGSLIESSYIIPILAFALSRSDQRGVDGLNTEDTIRDVEIE